MHIARTIRSTVITVACAAILVGPALAGGEPKNELPFTPHVTSRAQAAANVPPKPEPMTNGEAKNASPFTGPATATAQSSNGFSWPDGGIGLIVGIGLTATLAALLTR